MEKQFNFKECCVRFFKSLKGFIAICIVFAIAFYVFVYVMDKPNFVEAEHTYNALKEIAYSEAENKNTDYEITDVLLRYEVSTSENGFKHVTLVGKDNVNFKFYISDDYEIIENVSSWKISTTTTIVAQILTSLLTGLFGGIVVYFSLMALDKTVHKKTQT